MPDFDEPAFELWRKFCNYDWMPGREVVSHLKFAPAASAACIDAIVYLLPAKHAGVFSEFGGFWGQWNDSMVTPWNCAWYNAGIIAQIRDLPEACAMRDGRKWKRIPQIVLTEHGRRHVAYDGLDVEFVVDVTELVLHSGLRTTATWTHIESAINRYHQRTLTEYERVGFLVVVDHGCYRVKRALHKKDSNESEFYYGGKDKRRFREFVTIGRDAEGIENEALLFEQLLNDPKTGETEIHNFLEQHPDILAEAMMGVPISHQPYFPSNKQTPDFVIAPVLPRDAGNWIKLLELKGPEARVLADKRRLHRGLSSAVTQALAQVSDYYESIYDPLNLAAVESALGFMPETAQRAVLIGRNPSVQDMSLWDKRRAERPDVTVVTYDDLWQGHLDRHAWRKGPYR